MSDQAPQETFAHAPTALNRLERVAHAAKVHGHTAANELGQNTGSAIRERIVDAAENRGGVGLPN